MSDDEETDNVVEFWPNRIGDNYVIPPERILESAMAEEYEKVIVIGVKDDTAVIASSVNAANTLYLMELVKPRLFGG